MEVGRCHCHYCNGRSGVHGPEAVALYRAEVAAIRAPRGEGVRFFRGLFWGGLLGVLFWAGVIALILRTFHVIK